MNGGRWEAGPTVHFLMTFGVLALIFGGLLIATTGVSGMVPIGYVGVVLVVVGQLFAVVATIAYGVRLGTRP